MGDTSNVNDVILSDILGYDIIYYILSLADVIVDHRSLNNCFNSYCLSFLFLAKIISSDLNNKIYDSYYAYSTILTKTCNLAKIRSPSNLGGFNVYKPGPNNPMNDIFSLEILYGGIKISLFSPGSEYLKIKKETFEDSIAISDLTKAINCYGEINCSKEFVIEKYKKMSKSCLKILLCDFFKVNVHFVSKVAKLKLEGKDFKKKDLKDFTNKFNTSNFINKFPFTDDLYDTNNLAGFFYW